MTEEVIKNIQFKAKYYLLKDLGVFIRLKDERIFRGTLISVNNEGIVLNDIILGESIFPFNEIKYLDKLNPSTNTCKDKNISVGENEQ